MSFPQAVPVTPSPSKKPIYSISTETSRSITKCLIRLIEGQKLFSEEFGLPLEQVFANGAEHLSQGDTGLVINRLLRNSQTRELSAILSDLLEHNLALHAALDGIAGEALEQLSPERIRKQSFGLLWLRPFAWFSYRRRHKHFVHNIYLRHHQLIAAGLSKAYISKRTQLRISEQPPTGKP